ncbi:Tn3 family transposase [Nocardia sp. NPDC005825]|uniref:Tn3 family transposase n=1 Tax=unclassified Nocardia TaxID=2637762 RepID=UPI0034071338
MRAQHRRHRQPEIGDAGFVAGCVGERREGKTQANLVEGRHDLARTIYHGRKGEMTRAYYEGMEDQLSALGLVLNCVVVWNTVYANRALAALRTDGYPVLDADVERLSAFVRSHIGIDGHYSFQLPDLGGIHRPLRDPDTTDDE